MAICDEPTTWDLMQDRTVLMVLSLSRAHNYLWEHNKKFVATFGLTWTQFVTLTALRQAPAPHRLLPSQLYGPVQVSSGGLTKILEGLEEKGFVYREENPQDRRGQFARLTAFGFEQVNNIALELKQDIAQTLKGTLSAGEQTELTRLVERLSKKFEQK